MKASKLFFYSLLILILTPSTFYSTPQEVFGASHSVGCDADGIQTGASAVVITGCNVGTGLTDGYLLITVYGDDGGNTHGAPTVTRGTGTVCGTSTETATIIGSELTNGDSIISMWQLLDANFAEGSADICVSWASSDPPDEWSADIEVFTGVDQTTPISASNSGTCSGTTDCQNTVNVATNEIGVWGLQCVDNANTTTLNAGDTEQFSLVTGGGDRNASKLTTDTTVATPSTLGIDTLSKSCASGQMKTIALANASAGAPVYNIDLMDVYQSSSTTLDSGTSVCVDVDTDSATTCTGNLEEDLDYRFEFEVDNSGTASGSPTDFDYLDIVGSADVLGSIVVGDIVDYGCGTNTDWTGLTVDSGGDGDIRTAVGSGTACSIATSGNAEFWVIVNTDGSDLRGGTGTFFVDDGSVSDTSAVMTFEVARTNSQENPITMTDTQRVDISIRLEDPMTMTDVALAVKTIFDTEEDPLTLTDNQEFDISIRIEDPMTVTDNQEFDTSIRLDNPITMTDIEEFDVDIEVAQDPMTMTDVVTAFRQIPDIEEDPITLTDNQEFDISIIIEDNMSLTDVEEFDTSIRLDNPITMTDDMTPQKFLNAPVQDPLTLTDNQEFDISIIIEDNMSLTDVEEFDTSIGLENPITMTDVVTANKQFNNVEEDPITLTDNQSFDISIRIEDPMTMTDTVEPDANRFDTEEDPMTMTDVMTATKQVNDAEQDPMTMTDVVTTALTREDAEQDPITLTDNQRFDISIRIEDPMTITDDMTPDHTVASGDNFDTEEDPVTMTEVLTLLCTGTCPEVPTPPDDGGGGSPVPVVADSDNDGILDPDDQCPLVVGVPENDGCPAIIEEVIVEPEPEDGFPFEFNELDIVDDFINLETTSPQAQVEELTLRWLGDEPVTITNVEIGDSPFEIQIENVPIQFGDDAFGFTQEQLIYTVQEPATVCGDTFSFDCVDELTYEIPVIVTGESNGKVVISEGSITIDNSGRVNPFFYSLLLLIIVPLVGALFWKRRRDRKPSAKEKLKMTSAKGGKTRHEVPKSTSTKAGSTKKLLKVTHAKRTTEKPSTSKSKEFKSGTVKKMLREK